MDKENNEIETVTEVKKTDKENVVVVGKHPNRRCDSGLTGQCPECPSYDTDHLVP